ncbi:hypothetical protein Tco_0201196 [Tanacetum coccineum]
MRQLDHPPFWNTGTTKLESVGKTQVVAVDKDLGAYSNVGLIEGEWGFEHTKAVFIKEIIPFVKILKDIFNVFDKDLLNEVTEVQTVFNQMEAVVQQYHVDKQCFEIKKKQFLIENDRLLDQIISQDIMNIVVNSSIDVNTSVNVNSFVAMTDSVNYVEMFNKAKSLNPLDSASYSACKYVKLIQELLGYVRDTCPDMHKPSKKLVVVTPINKKKTVSSMFDARHELCFLEFVFDMNASSKSNSVKKTKRKKNGNLQEKCLLKLDITGDPQEELSL